MSANHSPLPCVEFRYVTGSRFLAASIAQIGRRVAAVLFTLPTLLLCLGLLHGTLVAAQTAHFSRAQFPVNVNGGLDYPQAVAVDGNGNIYIADAYNSRVVKLTPSGAGYTQSTVGTGLQTPYGVAVDSSGNVYIADIYLTTLLKETPSGSGYTQTTIGSGLYDAVSVAVDSLGNVYAVEINNSFIGTLLVETLSGGSYQQNVIPTPGSHGVYTVSVDSLGNLFVDDGWDNATYELKPSGGGDYTSTNLSTGGGTVAIDPENNLYIANYPGNITEMTPSGGSFTDTSIPTNATNTPYGYFVAEGMAVDAKGNIYFTDGYTYSLIELSTEGGNLQQIPVGGESYLASMFFTFDTPGAIQNAGVVTEGASSLDYTDNETGDCYAASSFGTGEQCYVDVVFQPAAAGLRTGAVELFDGLGNPIATGYVEGTGVAPDVTFPGAAPANDVTGLSAPYGIAVDAQGNLAIANSGGPGVLFVSPGGSQSPVGSGFASPTGIALDGAGNAYVADNGAVYEVLRSNSAKTSLNITGLSDPSDLAVDGQGDIYVSEPNQGTVIELTPFGVQTNVGTGLTTPKGLAVDAAGNLYIADYGAGKVFEVTPAGAQSSITGLTTPSGVAVDAAGNLYVAEFTTGTVLEIAAGGTRTTVATGLSGPYGVAVDAVGNVYVSETSGNAVVKIDRADPPALQFASTGSGTTSSDSPRTVTISNGGNAPLTVPVPNSGNNPSISANFALASNGAPDCPLVASGSTAGSLATGATCELPISFTPGATANGAIAGSLILTDNALNAAAPGYATQTIALSGTAIAIPAAMLTPAPGSTLTGSTANFTWSVGSQVTQYDLHVGTTGVGSSNIKVSGSLTTLTYNVTGIPIAGGTLYVRLYSLISGVWHSVDYTYTEIGTPAAMSTPTPGDTLSGSAATFNWTAGTGVAQYDLYVGTTGVGSSNIKISGSQTALSYNVTGIPTTGGTLYVRLLSLIGGSWQHNDYTYTEAQLSAPAAMSTPTPGSTLTGSAATFTWTTGTQVAEYDLHVGTTGAGSSNIFGGTVAGQSKNVTGIPTTGGTLYVRLYSLINAVWQYNDYTYTEAAATPAAMSTPTPGSTLTGAAATFTWTAGTEVTEYDLHVGTTGPGSSNIFGGTVAGQSKNVTGIPTTGGTLYVRLYSLINAVWQYNDYTYTEDN